MIWELWYVLRRDTGDFLGSHVLRYRSGDLELQGKVEAWAHMGPVVLWNTSTREVYY